MIFHSIIPYDVVFQEDEGTLGYTVSSMMYNGCMVEVLSHKNGPSHIRRIYSTSPKDYLDPKLQPGMNITQ